VAKQHNNTHLCSLKKDTHNPSTDSTPSTSSKMSLLIPSTTPLRTFEDHEYAATAVAVFPDKRRTVTGSDDKTLCLWDLETGVVLKKMEGHHNQVWALAVSRDGQIIASGDSEGGLVTWHGETGEPLIQPIKAHSAWISSLDFSLDGAVLATASSSSTRMVKFWCTKTWQMQGEPIKYDPDPNGYLSPACVQYSPSGELLAIATCGNIGIYHPGTRECVISFNANYAISLTWTPDGTRLLSGSYGRNPTIREWDTTTWKQVGHPWEGHTGDISTIAIHPAGTLVASTSVDKHVRLWRLSDRRTIAIFQHSVWLESAIFSADGKHIFSIGDLNKISEWAVPNLKASLRS